MYRSGIASYPGLGMASGNATTDHSVSVPETGTIRYRDRTCTTVTGLMTFSIGRMWMLKEKYGFNDVRS